MGRDDRIAEILGEWRERAESGEHMDVDALIEANADVATSLRAHFDALELVDQFFDQEPPVDPMAPPPSLGDHRIVREIGRGGMGVVYEAEQLSMMRRVALKVLFPTIASTARARKRFEREARITGRLHHTNIVTVHSMGRADGYLYFSMELVRGEPLDRVIEELRSHRDGEIVASPSLADSLHGRASYRRIAAMFVGAADALHVAHAQGVVHRDVKPSNLVLDEEGVLKLTDFGLAHLAGEGFGVTRTGEMIGTPLYMSPEQVRARREDVDLRTDVYSLGATLYELLTQERPHDGADMGTLCSQILTQQPRSLRDLDPHIPRDLATIVEKAMEKARGDRYASAGAMARDLRAFSEGRSIQARPVGFAGRQWRRVKRHKIRSALMATVLLLAIVGAVLFAIHRSDQSALVDRQYADLVRQAVQLREDPAGIALVQWSEPESIGFDNEARALLDRAIALRPEAPGAYAERFVTGGLAREEGVEDLERSRERGLPMWRYWVLRGLRDVAKKRYAEAGQALIQAKKAGVPAEDVSHRWLRIYVARRQGQHDDVDRLVAATLARPHLGTYDRLRLLSERAHARMARGDYAGAIEDYSALPARDARLAVNVRLQITILWHRLGETDRSQRVFNDVLDRMKRIKDVKIWVDVSNQIKGLRLFDLAERLSREMLAAFPKSWEAKAARASALCVMQPDAAKRYEARTGRNPYEEALRLLPEIREEYPLRIGWLGMKTLALIGLGRYEETLKILDERVALGGKETGNQRAVVLFRMGRHDDSIHLLRKLAAEHPEQHGHHCNLHRMLQRLGRHEEALVAGREALRTDPNCHLTLEVQAAALQATGRWEECLQVSELMIANHGPSHPAAYYRRVVALFELQRHAEVPAAAAAFRSSNKTYHWLMDRMETSSLFRLGRREEAWKVLRRWKASKENSLLAVNVEMGLLRAEGKVAQALALSRTCAQEFPGDRAVWEENALYFLRELGRMEDAKRAAAVILAAPKGHPPSGLIRALVTVGRVDAARKIIGTTDWTRRTPDLNRWNGLASVWSLVGDAEKALSYLTKMAEGGQKWSPHIAPDSDKAFVWDDPRFVELRKKHAVAPLAPSDGAEETDR